MKKNYLRLMTVIVSYFLLGISISYGKDLVNSKSNEREKFENLLATLHRYQSSGQVDMKFKKTLYQEVLSKEVLSEGKLSLSKEKFRLEVEEPEKTLLVCDGNTLWTAEVLPEGSTSTPQVSKAVLSKKNKSEFLFSLLMGDAALEKAFKAKRLEDAEGLENYELLPKGEVSLKDLSISILKGQKEIKKIKFVDDIGNKTTFEFSNLKLYREAKPNLFKYKPPKGAQVTNL